MNHQNFVLPILRCVMNNLFKYRDKPMAVGGMGMLSTSNYAARKFGVRAAMPGQFVPDPIEFGSESDQIWI